MKILVKQAIGDVTIEGNEVRNMNTESIWVFDNIDSNILIAQNKIVSGVYGSYALNRPYAGYGISAHTHWEASTPHSGFNVKIVRNHIELGKVNYCGIAVHGPLENIVGAVKLTGGEIKENSIFLLDGAVGVQIYRCDDFSILENSFTGSAYYGVQVIGSEKKRYYDYTSNNNLIEANDFSEFEIKKTSKYSHRNIDFHRFTGSDGKAKLAHIWLNKYSTRNRIHLKTKDIFIDDGKENDVMRTS